MISEEEFNEICDKVEYEQERKHTGLEQHGIDHIINDLEVAKNAFDRVTSATMHMQNIGRLTSYTYIMDKMFERVVGIAKQCKELDNPYYESPMERLEKQKAEMEGFERIYDEVQKMRSLQKGTNTRTL